MGGFIRKKQVKGFTLVELMTVAAIIILLMSIMIPSLSRSRELTRRTVCLSNMRHMYTVCQLYADTYEDQLPIGYAGDRDDPDCHFKQRSYLIHENDGYANVNWFTEMGQLYLAGLITEKNCQSFFCPSNIDKRFIIKVEGPARANVWPPYKGAPAVNGELGSQYNLTRTAFASRPVGRWWGGIGSPDPLSDGRPPDGQAKISSLPGASTLLADHCFNKQAIMDRHREGINAISVDGCASWRPAHLFWGDLPEDPKAWAGDYTGAARRMYNDNMLSDDGTRGVWADIDSR